MKERVRLVKAHHVLRISGILLPTRHHHARCTPHQEGLLRAGLDLLHQHPLENVCQVSSGGTGTARGGPLCQCTSPSMPKQPLVVSHRTQTGYRCSTLQRFLQGRTRCRRESRVADIPPVDTITLCEFRRTRNVPAKLKGMEQTLYSKCKSK